MADRGRGQFQFMYLSPLKPMDIIENDLAAMAIRWPSEKIANKKKFNPSKNMSARSVPYRNTCSKDCKFLWNRWS